MVEEYNSIIRNIIWEVVARPEDKSMTGLIWIYKVRQATYESIKEHKAIFVAKGFSQVEGIEGFETFDKELHV